jgi:antitoxin (DNA-binding transcriptional repressor) of toxin-antitoxin stability system
MKHREPVEPKATRDVRRAKAVRQLRHAFGDVMDWIAKGEQVEIIKKGKIVALLSPPPRRKQKKVKLPDFEARRKRIFGDRVLPGNAVAEERESYEW